MFESIDKYYSIYMEPRIAVKIDDEKIEEDVARFKKELTNLSHLLSYKIIFVVGQDEVEVFNKSQA